MHAQVFIAGSGVDGSFVQSFRAIFILSVPFVVSILVFGPAT